MNTKKLIIICGLPESGKTTFRKALEPLISGADTSDAIVSEAARVMRTTREEILARKNHFRPLLVAIGDAWVLEGLTDLADRAIESTGYKTPVISVAGVRRKDELEAIRQKYEPNTEVIAVWIERPGLRWIPDNTDPKLRDACDLEFTVCEMQGGRLLPQNITHKFFDALLNRTGIVGEKFSLLPIQKTS